MQLLLGIAVFGVYTLNRAAKGTVDLTMVNQVGTGVDKFEEAVGFLPPLVKDRLATGLPRPLSQLTYPRTGTRNAILVYEPDIQTDIDALNLLPTNLGTISTNPFEDEYRYSESSLAFFLVGALDARFDENNAADVNAFAQQRRLHNLVVLVNAAAHSDSTRRNHLSNPWHRKNPAPEDSVCYGPQFHS